MAQDEASVRCGTSGGLTVLSVPPGSVRLDEAKPTVVLNVLPTGMPSPGRARVQGEPVTLATAPDAYNLHAAGTDFELIGVNTGTKLIIDLGKEGLAGRLDGIKDLTVPVLSGTDPAIGTLGRLAVAHLRHETPDPVYIEALGTAMLARAVSAPASTRAGLRPGDADVRIQRALDWIEANLAKKISLRAAAEIATLSPSRLSRVFRASTGQTFAAYVAERRIERAMILLLTTSTRVSDIAAAVGFADASHMSRTFRRRRGYTPGDVRSSR